jgi:hypothetical protein
MAQKVIEVRSLQLPLHNLDIHAQVFDNQDAGKVEEHHNFRFAENDNFSCVRIDCIEEHSYPRSLVERQRLPKPSYVRSSRTGGTKETSQISDLLDCLVNHEACAV